MSKNKMAEEDTPEGNRIFDQLKQEFVEKFWKVSTSFEDANTAQPMSA